jgi:low molecular weight protein-tyrosine phosphatase
MHSELLKSVCEHRRVLFICTGNFYRSRFAEAVFNHHAEQRHASWTAFSRGLAVHLAEGRLSPFTAEALCTRKIEFRHTGLDRVQLSEEDLSKSYRCVAMDRLEHFPMMLKQFPTWADRIDYWDVSDIPYRCSTDALPEIEIKVIQLLEEVSR